MSLIRIKRQCLLNILKPHRFYATSTLTREDEYTEAPQYPEILDLSSDKRKEREKQAYHEQVKAVKTVEEKQIKLNMPKYYGFKCFLFNEDYIPYNNLQLTQHVTRTHLIEQESLPDHYGKLSNDSAVESIKRDVEDALVLEYTGYQKPNALNNSHLSNRESEDIISAAISKHVNRAVITNLCESATHLRNAQVDVEPRIESFWFAGGMAPPAHLKKSRKNVEWLKHKENEPVDRPIQYVGQPNLTLRSELPLPPIVPHSDAENASLEVPFFEYDPRVVGMFGEHRRAVNTPGFWPGDSHQFGLLSYHRRGHMLERTYNDPQDNLEAVHRQGVLTSFGWLNAQANLLGFTTYNDITYPLVTQCVITNGQLWSFYVYQLNTLLIHSNNPKDNPKRNICWATRELKLFEEVKDGKVIGLNDEVLKILVKFYANSPQERQGVELRPYLSKEEKLVSDYEDDDKRQWLEREYKFITSNRPRHYLPYEVYLWEKIYKIDHKRRPMEAKRRPFELSENPWDRKYDDRQARYIPRKLRPNLKRHLGRYAKEYFP